MRWAEISIETTSDAEDAVSNIMMETGCRGVAIQGGAPVVVTCYLPVDDRLEKTLLEVRARLKALPGFGLEIGKGEVSVRYAADDDWSEAWKQFFHVVRVGKRIVIKPTWEEFSPSRSDLLIELDPGMAFGTGNHATTRLCLQALESCLSRGALVVDFGTGSGILAIAAARLGAKLVIAFDSDPLAVTAARANVQQNDLEETIEVHQADSLDFINAPVDIITANLIADAVAGNARPMASLLREGGILIASGIITEKSAEVQEALQGAGLEVAEVVTEGEWVAVIAQKGGSSGKR